jgi:hypothetical protein
MITEQEIIQFLVEKRKADPAKISLLSELLDDLGIDGWDADLLMEAFSKRFAVDMANYDGSKYFGPEAGWNPLFLVIPSWKKAVQNLKPITVEHLLRCANDGVWHDV